VQGIYCSADGLVEMRTCKLGVFEGAIELLSRRDAGDSVVPAAAPTDADCTGPTGSGGGNAGGGGPADGHGGQAAPPAPADPPAPRYRVRSRRRSCLRTSNPAGEHAGAAAARALCPDRFAGLEARWFWVEPVDVGRKLIWPEQNARAVWEAQRDHPDWSKNRLARAFPQVSRPTVVHALRLGCEKWGDPSAAAEQTGGSPPPGPPQ
jgi:hypothetical protein